MLRMRFSVGTGPGLRCSSGLFHAEALARPQRKEVFIESLDSQFVENVYERDYRSPEAAEEDPEPLFEYYDKEGPQGFFLTLNCRTPNVERGKFIEGRDGLIQRLKASGQKQQRGFYIDGVRLVADSSQNGSTRGRPRPTVGRTSRGRGRGAAGSSGGSAFVAKPSAPTKLDPLTFEDASEDWMFSVVFVVALDDLPEEKTPETPTLESKTEKKPKRSSRGGRGDRGGGR